MIDLFVIILVLWAAFSGWRNGFLKEIISSAGFLIGLFVAATCYATLGKYLSVDGTETNMFTSIVAFFILWIIVPIALGFGANLLTKAMKGIQLGMPNSILGALVGILKYALLISCVFNAMDAHHIMNKQKAAESKLYKPTAGIVKAFFNNDEVEEEKADTTWVRFDR